MGLITNAVGKIAEHVVKGVVKDAAVGAVTAAAATIASVDSAIEKTLELTVGDKATRHYRREQRYLSKKKESICLIIQKTNVKNELFSIYDADENVRYYANGKLTSKVQNVNLILMDANRRQIASVKKKAIALRNPLFHEQKPADYYIEVMGNQIATLKTKLSLNREDYEIEPFGWTIKGSVLRWDFKVMDGEDEVVHIRKRKGYDNPTFILDFPNEQYELIGLMIVLTLICRE